MAHSVSGLQHGAGDTGEVVDGQESARVYSTAGQALCAIGLTGQVLAMTVEFESLVGDALFVSNDRLRAARREEDAALQALLSSMVASCRSDNDAPAFARLTRADGTAVIAHGISIAGRRLSDADPVAILVVDAPDMRVNGEQLLCKTYGLTCAEARLAARLAAGATLRNAATSEGITYETARSRLKTIFRKTDTARQAELVLLLSRFP